MILLAKSLGFILLLYLVEYTIKNVWCLPRKNLIIQGGNY